MRHCPFCGGGNLHMLQDKSITCRDCQVKIIGIGHPKADASQVWEQRADDKLDRRIYMVDINSTELKTYEEAKEISEKYAKSNTPSVVYRKFEQVNVIKTASRTRI